MPRARRPSAPREPQARVLPLDILSVDAMIEYTLI